MPTSTPKINICKACQQEVPELKFGYCSVCGEDMEKADLQLAIGGYIPEGWRIGQFVFNFLNWLGGTGYVSTSRGIDSQMADPFHLSDEEFISYWLQYLKTLNKKEDYDPGPCYRCHQWPCDCKEGPLMSRKQKKH